MKVERIVKKYEEVYIAEDGTKWSSEELCKQYEELLKNPSPIKSLKFFDSNGNPINIFALGEIPMFSYLVIEEDRIKYYNWSVVKAIIGTKNNNVDSYNLPHSKGVYYNKGYNPINGGYYSNDWVRLEKTTLEENIESLENQIKSCQDKIEVLKKMKGLV